MFSVQTGTQVYPIHISQKMGHLLTKLVRESGVSTGGGLIINFRDPDYGAERGGYHPVEIGIDPLGKIHYVTDFAFVGPPGYAELEKELDWDIRCGAFQHLGHEYPISQGRSMYQIWERNFLAYVGMGIFKVKVMAMG